jgi:hypothetical protein
VLWVGTSPKMFGYSLHHNICADKPLKEPQLPDAYLFNADFHGHYHEFPYQQNEFMFEYETVSKSLDF